MSMWPAYTVMNLLIILYPLRAMLFVARPTTRGLLPHHPIEVAALQPRQLLGEHRNALPPGARHLCFVGAREHASRRRRRGPAANGCAAAGTSCYPDGPSCAPNAGRTLRT